MRQVADLQQKVGDLSYKLRVREEAVPEIKEGARRGGRDAARKQLGEEVKVQLGVLRLEMEVLEGLGGQSEQGTVRKMAGSSERQGGLAPRRLQDMPNPPSPNASASPLTVEDWIDEGRADRSSEGDAARAGARGAEAAGRGK